MPTQSTEGPLRLRSLDAYRGFVMLAMASGGAGALGRISAPAGSALADALAILRSQGNHAVWRGGTAWDLIQPSFMFMVGVAMPFSFAARVAKGDPWIRMFAHALTRSLILVFMALFLASNGEPFTNFSFVNVLGQIGLGYPFVFLLLKFKPSTQIAAALLILVADCTLFAAYPLLATEGVDPSQYGVNDPSAILKGFFGHWSMNTNVASAFDRWFLNLFPRSGKPFVFNEGGYATLNFIPSIATMIVGVVAGELLRSSRPARSKLLVLLIAGATCLLTGILMDGTICPMIKRIWTPSWTFFSAGWTLWLLAGFYGVIDLAGYKRWSFPLVVVGMNSIAIYFMAQLMKPFVASTLRTHLGAELFQGTYGPLIRSSAILLVFWLICYWMYRHKIFVRI